MRRKKSGKRIERARLLHNWSQSDLAACLEASRSSVHRWEHDKTFPLEKTREKLITVLGLPDDVFVKQRKKTQRNKAKNPPLRSTLHAYPLITPHDPRLPELQHL